jgi:hypothetical protein
MTATPSQAWFSRGSKNKNAAQEKPFSKKHARSLAGKLVRGLLRQEFFHKDELSMRVELGLVTLDVRHKDMTDREFTDMVLNAASDFSEIIVVNQEPSLSVKRLDQKLISYDGEWVSRRRGVMLGADFIMTGTVRENVLTDEKGRSYTAYDGTLVMKNIRKGSVVAEHHEQQNKKKMKRKR